MWGGGGGREGGVGYNAMCVLMNDGRVKRRISRGRFLVEKPQSANQGANGSIYFSDAARF